MKYMQILFLNSCFFHLFSSLSIKPLNIVPFQFIKIRRIYFSINFLLKIIQKILFIKKKKSNNKKRNSYKSVTFFFQVYYYFLFFVLFCDFSFLVFLTMCCIYLSGDKKKCLSFTRWVIVSDLKVFLIGVVYWTAKAKISHNENKWFFNKTCGKNLRKFVDLFPNLFWNNLNINYTCKLI